jgi:hypothetical protein
VQTHRGLGQQHVVGDSDGCTCGWESRPQAFQWFPELGGPILSLPGNNPLSTPPSTTERAQSPASRLS